MNQQHEGSPVAVLKSTPPSGRGWLRNGNVPGDFHNCERCGAKTRAGPPCLSPAMKNGRCRMHGGKSTGPRTEAGLERCRQAHRKTGHHSQARRNYSRMLSEVTRCVIITGEIARATNKASDPGTGGPQSFRRDARLMEKAEHLLHRVWTSEPFLTLARGQVGAMYREYLRYCRLTNHPLPLRSRFPAQLPVEGWERAQLLVDLLRGYVEVMSSRPMLTNTE
jgi:hypothetical protein